MEDLRASLLEVISAAEHTATSGAKLVSLILTYTAIDTAAWLASDSDADPVGARFQRWADKYLLPQVPRLSCTAEELYAARCGVLHTMTGDADLHAKKPLRRIAYAWGGADARDLAGEVSEAGLSDKLVAIHLTDLTEGLRLGVASFLEEALADPVMAGRLEMRSRRFFTNVPKEEFQRFRNPEA